MHGCVDEVDGAGDSDVTMGRNGVRSMERTENGTGRVGCTKRNQNPDGSRNGGRERKQNPDGGSRNDGRGAEPKPGWGTERWTGAETKTRMGGHGTEPKRVTNGSKTRMGSRRRVEWRADAPVGGIRANARAGRCPGGVRPGLPRSPLRQVISG